MRSPALMSWLIIASAFIVAPNLIVVKGQSTGEVRDGATDEKKASEDSTTANTEDIAENQERAPEPDAPAEPTELPKLSDAQKAEAEAMPAVGKSDPEWKRLSKDGEAWIDLPGKRVIVDGEICLREGPLEMFACPRRTKEHESIVAVHSRMLEIHAALLRLGAKKGTTAKFQPVYQPPTGSEIEVRVFWRTSDGQPLIAKAQDWIWQGKEKKPTRVPFVFAGSQISQVSTAGSRRYLADDGDFICLANFSSAMLDVPMESTQANEGLLFRANPHRIPALGSKVRVVLTVSEEKPKEDTSGSPQ